MIEMRSCRVEDCPDVFNLLQQKWPEKNLNYDTLYPIFVVELYSDYKRFTCAESDQKMVGFSCFTIQSRLREEGYLAYVEELIVEEEHLGQGIGTGLLEYILVLAKESGCKRVELDAAFHRTETHRFVEKHGFGNRGYIFSHPLV
jgi:GNAT superfamily N-acetyltransferase